jgi:hypothetical protein
LRRLNFPPKRWFFHVNRLPCFYYRYLVEGSCGIPYYCEELLKNLDHHRVLLFQQMESEDKTNVTWSNMFSKSLSDAFSCSVFPSLVGVQRRWQGCRLFHRLLLYGQRVWERQEIMHLISQIVRRVNIAWHSLDCTKECINVIIMKEQ